MTAAIVSDSETETLPIIEFVAPMPGFPDDHNFVLVRLEDDGLLYALTAVESRGLRFLVVPPAPFFPDYSVEVDDETLSALGTLDPEDLLPLLVVSPGQRVRDSTVNLLAPIVFDQRTMKAIQLVMTGSGLPVRAPLLRE